MREKVILTFSFRLSSENLNEQTEGSVTLYSDHVAVTEKGKEIKRIDALTEGQITDSIVARDDITLYTRVGNLFTYLCIAFLVTPLVTWGIAKIQKERNIA